MRILVLTKRQYSGKDLIDDRFGRMWELPRGLAALGHSVKGICLSYRPREQGWHSVLDDTSGAKIDWFSLNLGMFIGPGLLRYKHNLLTLVSKFRPELIWTASDSFHAVLGVWLGRHCRIRCVVDLYDNFESFPATRWFPGMRQLFRHSLKKAQGISCVSVPLQRKLAQELALKCPVAVIENAVDSGVFAPGDKLQCRTDLGLPPAARIIGTAGAMQNNRGIQTLMDAFGRLSRTNQEIHLAFAGPRGRNFASHRSDHIHDLGILPQQQVPLLLNALDVAVISNLPSAFGNYCFPQKFYEIVSCNTPLVAASIGALELILRKHPQCLFTPGDPVSLAAAIEKQLRLRYVPDIEIPQWSHQAERLNGLITKIARA